MQLVIIEIYNGTTILEAVLMSKRLDIVTMEHHSIITASRFKLRHFTHSTTTVEHGYRLQIQLCHNITNIGNSRTKLLLKNKVQKEHSRALNLYVDEGLEEEYNKTQTKSI